MVCLIDDDNRGAFTEVPEECAAVLPVTDQRLPGDDSDIDLRIVQRRDGRVAG